ncbi:hypothetical protein AVEN_30141-1 [Araneus ventricosus]|uniref:Uncharacterized protein n=1 Tax=Araneus ventricosus TaxID=182803 RepID=A0A4Y2Q4M4_ARAVE|nr:hypothetical protein AVEN_30141-1 [Araneus ventricosus]
MAFLGLARKNDLQVLATDLGVPISDNLKIIQLRNLITSSEKYEEEFVKNLLSSKADEGKMAEQAAEKDKVLTKKEVADNERVEKKRLFELEKLKIQLELQTISQKEAIAQGIDQPKMDVTRIVPRFNPKEDEIGLYLTIFERQLKFLNIPESK